VGGGISQLIGQAIHHARLVEQTQEADRLKSRFLSMVSHELRTPLNIIVSLSDLALKPKSTPHPDDLRRINTSAQHLSGLINDVLDLASSQSGHLRLNYQALNPADILSEIHEIGCHLAEQKGLAWSSAFAPDLPLVWADRTRIRQVILNLVMNAVKFTDQGRIDLSALVEAGQVQIAVSDTGIGIPPGEQHLIFDEFRQSERTAARAYGGMGLGLAICKRLVELHGGQIGVDSVGRDGAGSTFRFSLPIYVPHQLPNVDIETILLIGEVNATVAQLMQAYGFKTVHIAPDLFNLVLAQNTPGAIAVPVNTPTSWDVLRDVRENPLTHHIPVLLCGEAGWVEADYLQKPLQDDAFGSLLIRQEIKFNETSSVLIVEDEPLMLDLHSRMVRSWLPQAQLLRANNGQAALNILQQTRPDLILLDLMMPGVNGFEVLNYIRSHDTTRDIPVVIITAQVLSDLEIERLSQGVTTILQKGVFNVEETIQHLKTTLDRSTRFHTAAYQLVQKAVGYIHANYSAEEFSRESIAQYLNVNSDYLTRCFTQAMGISPITYLNRYRVQQAKILLETTIYSISDIADKVGFGDYAHFSRTFRRHVGLSPREYRHGTAGD
jgi:AraC-like DNA-binding protein/anti-sigma regulatory factor (Ser/Thr protein kinase)